MAKLVLFGSFLLAASLVSADTLLLRGGKSVEGTFVGGDARSVRFDDGHSAVNYPIGEVESIRFVGGAPAPRPTNDSASADPQSSVNSWPTSNTTPGTDTPPPSYSNPNAPQQSATTSASTASSVQIPSGTQVVVRLIDAVNSDNDHLGQTYRVSLDEPILVNGQTAVPRGADAVAFLIDAEHSGKIQGRASVTLDLKTLTVNGKQYDVTTTGVSEASEGRGARSAKVIGGTAAVGAIIGAIAGGGKGAAIGAGSGAAVGTAAQVVTSGQKVKIPAETRLTFTLQNPITIS